MWAGSEMGTCACRGGVCGAWDGHECVQRGCGRGPGMGMCACREGLLFGPGLGVCCCCHTAAPRSHCPSTLSHTAPAHYHRQVPFAIIFTKSDVKKKTGPSASANMAAFKRSLLEGWEALPACFETSSRTGGGKTEVLQYLASLRILEEREG